MFSEIVRIWLRVLLRPAVVTFEHEAAGASLDRTLVGISLAGVLIGTGYFLSGVIAFIQQTVAGLPGTVWETTPLGLMRSAFVGFVVVPLVFVLGFFLAARMSLALARLVSASRTATADFTLHAYLLSLAVAPTLALAALLAATPVAGPLLAAAAVVYQFILAALAVRSIHQAGFPAAFLVWLLPVTLVTLLFSVTYSALVALVNAMAQRGR